MQRQFTVNLGNLVLSLSDAMDLASSALAQHQQKTAFIGWEMGRAAGLSSKRLENNFIAALVHDIGALSLEEKISIRSGKIENDEVHCIRGERLLENIFWLRDAARIVRYHHTDWQKWEESIESPLAFDSQLIALADYVERMIDRDKYILHQHEEIIASVRSRSGSRFHPQVIDLFIDASVREEFWLDLASPRLYSILLNEGPFRKTEIGVDDVLLMSKLSRNIIDFRSRFTSTHSSGVAKAATMMCELFGLSEAEIKLMEIAGDGRRQGPGGRHPRG